MRTPALLLALALPPSLLALHALPTPRQTPAQGDPAQGNPTQGDPAQGDPAQGDPTQRDPTQRDPAQGEPELPPPAGAIQQFQIEERKRLTEEIEGAWLLVDFRPPVGEFPSQHIQGFALFDDGYLSLTIMMRTFEKEFLGDGIQHGFQAAAYRYRISDFLTLQTAALLGFTNINPNGVLEFFPANWASDFRLEIEGTSLRLTRADGASFSFLRLGEAQFPDDAVLQLNRRLGTGGVPDGAVPEPPPPPPGTTGG